MNIKKIFVAGSKALVTERNLFRIVASEVQSEYCKRGVDVNLQVVTFETFHNCFTQKRKQEAYNEYIEGTADVVYFILDGRLGGITEEEFNVAFEAYQRSKKPLLCVFSCRNDVVNEGVERLRRRVSEVGQYYAEYEDEKELRYLIEKNLRYIVDETGKPHGLSQSTKKLLKVIPAFFIFLMLLLGLGARFWTPIKQILSRETFKGETVKCEVNGVAFNMVAIPAGTFVMGGYDGDAVQHQVTISEDFLIGETEVTQELWCAVMRENPSSVIGDKLPVNNVSWNECVRFISKLNEMTGENYRLPTEAEWEYVAKSGQKDCAYSGNELPDNVAWYIENSGSKVQETKQKSPNGMGVYDMSGNVWEWCSDFYEEYNINASFNPQGPKKGSRRVRRGGSYLDNAKCCLVTFRSRNSEDVKKPNQGFRLVKQKK